MTYHENAYKYFEHELENDITFLSAVEIVENPMILFAWKEYIYTKGIHRAENKSQYLCNHEIGIQNKG